MSLHELAAAFGMPIATLPNSTGGLDALGAHLPESVRLRYRTTEGNNVFLTTYARAMDEGEQLHLISGQLGWLLRSYACEATDVFTKDHTLTVNGHALPCLSTGLTPRSRQQRVRGLWGKSAHAMGGTVMLVGPASGIHSLSLETAPQPQ